MRAAAALLLLLAGPASATTPFQGCFEIASQAHSVPLDLLQAVARTESAMDPAARSHANAHGVMQIQWPGTARHLGFRRVSELYNPCLNIDAGARYLRELTDRYRGDEARALAAYNYGPTRIKPSGPVPAGATRYVSKVLNHRARFHRGDPDAWAGSRLPLGHFSSATRAQRAANFLTAQLGGPQVNTEATDDGHSLFLDVPPDGLPALASARLHALGYTGGQ